MIRAWSEAAVRHRRPVLVAGIVLALASVALAPAYPVVVFPTVAGGLVLLLGIGIAMGWRLNRRPPERLVASAEERSLRTPDLGIAVVFWLDGLQMLALGAGFAAEEASAGRSPWVGLLGAALAAAVTVPLWRAAWRGSGLTLRPQGIEARKGAGTLHVPWDALSPTAALPGDTPYEIRLDYARPALVTRSGVMASRATIIFEGVERDFVLAAIRYYAAHPDRRYAIGTAGEAEPVRAALESGPERTKPPEPPPTVGAIVGRAILAAVLFGMAVVLNVADDTHPFLGYLAPLPGMAAVAGISSAIRGVRARRRAAATVTHPV